MLILIAAIFLSGLINPVIGRRNAKSLLNECGGMWWRTDSNSIEEYEELTLIDEVLTEWHRLAIEKVVISPIPKQDHQLKRFLSQHRGLRGLESLTILSYPSIGEASYHPIYGLQDLRFLRIKQARLDRNFFQSVSAIEDLEKIILIECEFDPASLKALSRSRHLAWVHIDNNDHKDLDIDIATLNEARQSLERIQVTLGDLDAPPPMNSP